MSGKRLWAEAKLAFRRLIVGDFQTEKATDEERELLAAAKHPVTKPQAQDYAAWRRSLLWIAGVLLILLGIVEIATFTPMEEMLRNTELATALGRDNLETIDGVFGFLILPVLVGGVLAILAAARWREVRISRRLARWGFLVTFLTPFLIAALPVKGLLEFPSDYPPEARKALSFGLGTIVGLRIFGLIGPRAIALFPGVIRSAMTLKTLIPESPMPGWASVMAAPLYSIFLLVVFALVNQIQGNVLLLLGLACMMLAPLVYLWRRRRILRPHRAEEVSAAVGRVRRVSGGMTALGFLFFCIFFLDVGGTFGDLLQFGLSVFGNLVLLTVVGADFLLALLHLGHDQSKALVESKLDDSLEERFTALEDVGFTDLGTGKEDDDEESAPKSAT